MDKMQHVVCNMTLLLALLYMTGSLLSAISIAIGVGLTKELVYDLYLDRGTSDIYDMLASTIGVILGIMLVLIFEWVKG
jgi:glycopeptide antibiotics resistance protein